MIGIMKKHQSRNSASASCRRYRSHQAARLFWMGAGALSLSLASLAQAQVLVYKEVKEASQTGPTSMVFDQGSLDISLEDGSFSIEGCAGNGGISIMQPNIFCPIGTTAFILLGDVDGNGEADTRSFWSVTNVVRARFIRPGYATGPNAIRLSAAPASSGLLGDLLSTRDASVTLFYNVLNPVTQQEYGITRYGLFKNYSNAQLPEMYDDLPLGIYQFRFPSLLSETGVHYINLLRNPLIEPWPGPTPVQGLGAFRMTNDWVNGALEFDPRFVVDFNWTGISSDGGGSSSASVVPSDRLYFSLRETATGRIVYPPFPDATPDGDRAPIWLEGQLYGGGVSIGPFFQLGFFEPGTELTGYLEVRRSLIVGGGVDVTISAYDNSERIFKWPVRFIDTYEGFAILAYPGGTPDAQISPTFDFDGDGYTNFEEFAYQTDPARPEDNPSQLVLPEIVEGKCVLTIQKRPFVGGRLDYYAEASTDGGVTWARVTAANPDWVITANNLQVLQVMSTSPFSAPSCMVRPRVKLINP
ncbi:MAG: hypothetical protein O3A87_03930 [Verrucomicrobia bacterium]|nr:hypothetical protein [Verrucomicrobiota bacterium]